MTKQGDRENDPTISVWLEELKQGDTRSQEKIWQAYFESLVRTARRKLAADRKRVFDEEDIALSAFNSFFRAVEERRLPKLDDRHDLWKVLVVIAARKISDRRKYTGAAKRGAGKVRGESVFGQPDDNNAGINQVLGEQPTAEMAAEVAEDCERLMASLPDETLRRVALLKLEGYSNDEIADRLDCVSRTVERKLERIRAIWCKAAPRG